jgi:hypothetical protein
MSQAISSVEIYRPKYYLRFLYPFMNAAYPARLILLGLMVATTIHEDNHYFPGPLSLSVLKQLSMYVIIRYSVGHEVLIRYKFTWTVMLCIK